MHGEPMPNPDGVSIRTATLADAEALVVLIREFYDEFGDLEFDDVETPKTLRMLLTDPALGTVLVPCVDGAPIGYLALMYCLSLEFHGRYAFVDELYIRKGFRGRGHGKRLLARAEDRCRADGLRALFLEVDRANPDTQRLYRNAGFQNRDHYHLFYKRLDPADH
ncbi:MAG: GNAT family N-acetyltransferase [Capsulimonadales bacterium]|nr:GNAT family N-acetyltransferase [Capsulimonadales bacterium]